MSGPFKMKGFSGFGNSPIKAKKTSLWGKMKSALGAVGSQVIKSHGHGDTSSLSHSISREYKKRKRQSRKEQTN